MSEIREAAESPLVQGVDEQIIYTLTTTAWGSSPGTITVAAFDVTGGGETDVSATVLSGTASAVGDVITLKKLKSLTAGKVYRVEVKFTCGSNVFECYFIVEAEK
jgi:hypothetical protein